MNKRDLLIKLHAYISSDGIIDTWKSKDIHGKKLRIRKRLRVRFYSNEKTLIDDFIESVIKIYHDKKYIRYSEKRMEVEVRGQIISKKILELGNISTTSWEMPKNLSNKQKRIWIRAFADCDGTIGYYKYNKYVAIDSINLKGLTQISHILTKFGIFNRIQNVKYKGKISYRLKVSRKENLIRYNRLIGFNHPYKQEKLIKVINSYKQNTLKTKFLIK
ncbi:MAG: LAGLIDADG family homing endonuclease [Nanoarchaeota archaeon]